MPAESSKNGIFVCEGTLGIDIQNHLTSDRLTSDQSKRDQLMYQKDQRLVMIGGRRSDRFIKGSGGSL